jgi:hypothetical protein
MRTDSALTPTGPMLLTAEKAAGVPVRIVIEVVIVPEFFSR